MSRKPLAVSQQQGWSFSPSRVGFYHPAVHVDLPADAVSITDETYNRVKEEERLGRVIVGGPNGQPRTVERPPAPTAAQLVLNAKVCLQVTDQAAIRCFKAGVAFPPEWRFYTEALRSIAAGGVLPEDGFPVQPPYPEGT